MRVFNAILLAPYRLKHAKIKTKSSIIYITMYNLNKLKFNNQNVYSELFT